MVWGVVILLVCLVLGLPIYLALLASGLYLLVIVKDIPIDIIIIGLYGGVAKFTLLAVPFFLLAGAFMQNSSISRRLVDCTPVGDAWRNARIDEAFSFPYQASGIRHQQRHERLKRLLWLA